MTGTVPPQHGFWSQTHSGAALDLLAPHPDSIVFDDIVRGLSRTARFNGQTIRFYSVAQHSLLVADILKAWGADMATQRLGLLHDAPEAYLGDIARPIKLLLPDYKRLEGQVWEAVAQRFGVPTDLPAIVKDADNLALRAEAWHHLNVRIDNWAGPLQEARLPSDEAELMLLAHFGTDYLLRDAFRDRWQMLGGRL